MKPFDDLVDRAKADPRHIVLAEGEYPRVVAGVGRAFREGLARITLVDRQAVMQSQLEEQAPGSGQTHRPHPVRPGPARKQPLSWL